MRIAEAAAFRVDACAEARGNSAPKAEEHVDAFLHLSVSMRSTASLRAVAIAAALSASGCAHLGAGTAHSRYLTPGERLVAIRRARVWRPTNIPAVNIEAGPARRDGFPPGATVGCDYRPDKLGGNTPKFACAISADDVVKVKYGKRNGEVYAAVAATRLLWALGFGADAIYPVHVICRGCPKQMAISTIHRHRTRTKCGSSSPRSSGRCRGATC